MIKLHAEGGKGTFNVETAVKQNKEFFNQRRNEQIAPKGNPRSVFNDKKAGANAKRAKTRAENRTKNRTKNNPRTGK